MQPKTVVALAKFEVDEKIKYEARYTNCYDGKEHAEDLFDRDLRHGELSKEISNATEGNRTKSITLYLTYQPCNNSTGKTQGTKPHQSCCEILKNLYSEKLEPESISLCIKATHTCRLVNKDKKLQRNAVGGIQLLKGSGVNVTGMERNDWYYLRAPTSDSRKTLDKAINKILAEIPIGVQGGEARGAAAPPPLPIGEQSGKSRGKIGRKR